MSVLESGEQEFACTIQRLSICNPFSAERVELERRALGPDAELVPRIASLAIEQGARPPITIVNRQLVAQTQTLVEAMRSRMIDGARPGDAEVVVYQDLVFFVLYYRYRARFDAAVSGALPSERLQGPVTWYDEFLADLDHYFVFPGSKLGSPYPAHHLFAILFQIRRGFYHIFAHIIGGAPSMAALRAAAWDSIFTHDTKRYARSVFRRMPQVTTLVTGPSGTGKELVARAIGLSQYIPFDPKTRTFVEEAHSTFHPLNLSALSPTLIESELFGHRRGSFTGAATDRAGWLETCTAAGTVFLDEIGDVDQAVQLKLLRVLETRCFQRLGETSDRRFEGKIIAATNRDLAAEMRAGRFRPDFYYRLCADLIETPSLADLLREAPQELGNMLRFIARKEAGDAEAESLAAETESFIERELGPDYEWPGNFRELEQCVRNVMVRGEYCPARAIAVDGAGAVVRSIRNGELTAEELLNRYCQLVHARTRNWSETARRLGLDRRTVQRRVAAALGEPDRSADDEATVSAPRSAGSEAAAR
jgi:DNA-binding NtrC family response regulator